MKASFCFLLLGMLLLSSSAYAQLEKGNWLVGGNAGFSRSTIDNQSFSKSSFSYHLSPNLGYMAIEGFVTGLVLSYDHTSHNQPHFSSSSKRDLHNSGYTFSLGPALQYYYRLEEKWAIGLQTSFTWGKQSATSAVYFPDNLTDPNGQSGSSTAVVIETKGKTTTLAVGPNLTYFLSSQIGLQGNLVYKMSRTDFPQDYTAFSNNPPTTKTSGLYFQVGLQ